MCQPKPGPRCSHHAKKELDKASLKYKKAERDEEGTTDTQRELLREDLVQKLKVWYSTPAGQKELKNKLNGPTSTRQRETFTRLLEEGKELREQQKQALAQKQLSDELAANPHLTTYDDKGFSQDGVHKDTGSIYDTEGRDKNGELPHVTYEEDEMFSNGDCWRLANDIHKKHGYDYALFYVVVDEDDDKRSQDEGWFHMANFTPEGDIIDIRGVKGEGDAYSEWSEFMADDGEIEIARITPEEYEKHSTLEGLYTQNPEQDTIDQATDKVMALYRHSKTEKELAPA